MLASTLLPTKYGELRMCAFRVGEDRNEHVALVKGDVSDLEEVPTYVHVECLIGHVLGSVACDCRRRLDEALERLARAEVGVVVYVRSTTSREPAPPSTRQDEVVRAIMRTLGARSFQLQAA